MRLSRVATSWGWCCGVIAATLVFVSSPMAIADPSSSLAQSGISELQTKGFRIASVNGKTTMTLVPGYRFDPAMEPWQQDDYTKCVNSTARLNNKSAATVIEGTNDIFAFLECPAGNDGYATSVIALFEGANTDVPICFSRIRLMDKEGYYFWGGVGAVSGKKQPDGSLFVAAKLSGGDAGDLWTSSAFLHIDRNCKTTLLAKFYESGRDSYDGCSGHLLSHRFVSNSVIQINRQKLTCPYRTQDNDIPTTVRQVSTRAIDLRLLFEKPTLRTFKP